MIGLAAGAAAGAVPEKQRGIIAIIITLVVVAIVVFVVIKITQGAGGILEALGFKRDPAEKDLDKAAQVANEQNQNSESPWSPQYYRNAQTKGIAMTLIPADKAANLSKQIWDSVGVFTDTPVQASSAIKQLPTKAAVSWLAEKFNVLYDRDLWDWLNLKFDTDEQKKVLTDMAHYVRSLPDYKR